eukprot:CAMPEP_0184866172 /NCGR_PEP_ID=MMETSP0580-20130426/21168_1 /TAXON_ID=1118495 /ORGANISM="Dactyliosolen fragilissimus" /LENGTH=502 /DNA_ID=CAMNT_0027365695 /DNA_START=194 /DNA_END=1702 /DNA_ORIENTATION=+
MMNKNPKMIGRPPRSPDLSHHSNHIIDEAAKLSLGRHSSKWKKRRLKKKYSLNSASSNSIPENQSFNLSTKNDARTGKELWAILRDHVMKGSFEIHDFNFSPEDDDTSFLTDSIRIDRFANHHTPTHVYTNEDDTFHVPYDYSIFECMMVLVAYLFIGVLAYSVVLEKWDIVDSLYFTVVTLTTVGYGDFAPSTQVGQLFTTFFCLTGVALLGIALGIIGSNVVEGQIQILNNTKENAFKSVSKVFDQKSLLARTLSSLSTNSSQPNYSSTKYSHMQHSPSLEGTYLLSPSIRREVKHPAIPAIKEMFRVFFYYFPAMMPILFGSVFIAYKESWPFITALYYAVVTSTTIEFGDFSPQKTSMKWFAIIFVPLAVGAMAHMLGSIANRIIEKRRAAYLQYLECKELTVEDLKTMDTTGDGSVSLLEYVEFMLIASKKVNRETLNEIHMQFHRLDLTGTGSLDHKDLELIAKRRLAKVRSKLSLSEYKGRLVHQSRNTQGDEKV